LAIYSYSWAIYSVALQKSPLSSILPIRVENIHRVEEPGRRSVVQIQSDLVLCNIG